MKNFSLTGLCLCLAAITMIGCDDDGDKRSNFVSQCDVDCESLPNTSSGACNNETQQCYIVCHANYFDCDKDYRNGCESKDPTCANQPGPGPVEPPAPDCALTFQYTNVDTCQSTGGTQDWPVYLIGTMNNWDPANTDFALTDSGNCVRKLVVDLDKDSRFTKGSDYSFKYYVSGWGETDSWRFNANGANDGENNTFKAECGTVVSFDEKTQSDNPGPGPGPGPSDGCQVTFSYTNIYTNKASGGDNDYNVYLVGGFNTNEDGSWKTTDGYKMNSNGNGTHTYTLKLNENESFEYKFYVDGWGDDSYKSDPNKCVGDTCNNVVDTSMCGQTISYVEQGGDNPGPGPEPGECTTTFKFHNKWTSKNSGGEQDWDVYLVGDFSMEGDAWKVGDPAYKMTSDGNGTHTLTVKWAQNETHRYKYYVDGWGEDSFKSDPSKCVGDFCDNEYTVNACGGTVCYDETGDGVCGGSTVDPGPGPQPCTGDSCPKPVTCDGTGGNYTINVTNGNAKVNSIKVDGLNITIDLKGAPSNVSGGVSPQTNGNTITDTVPENGKYTYYATVDGNDIYIPVWVECEQFDWHDAILYFAFTDRFFNGNTGNDKKSGTWENSSATDWYGGDFEGLRKKVEEGYFDALGVNTLWISSVTKNTEATSAGTNGDTHNYSAYHSYWPVTAFMTDYNQGDFNGLPAIEDHFGTMDELKALVDACHKRGIRVLVDFAANHVFKDSPVFQKHQDWFNDVGKPTICDDNNGWGWDNYSEKCWFSADLPDINYENADARKTMVDHAVWLIKNTNIDGFRVDAVKHMNVQFIKELRAATESLYANSGIMFYMVGETFTGGDDSAKALLNKYIGDDLLHAQFDFPLYYIIGNVLRGNGLYQAVREGKTGYESGFKSDLMGTFMGNHDVARAISVASAQNENKWGNNPTPSDWTPYNRLMAAWMILLTQPGIPLIYYGDEFGMPGSNDPDNRRMMLFGNDLNEQQKTTLGFVQSVVNIRRAHKALSRGKKEIFKEIEGSDNSTECFKMTLDGSESIIVGIGLADNSGHAPGKCKLGQSYNLKNLFDGTETSTDVLDLTSNNFQLWLVK